MSRRTLVILPHAAAQKIRDCGLVWGRLSFIRYGNDDMYAVSVFQAGSGVRLQVAPRKPQPGLIRTDDAQYEGRWHRAEAITHMWHWGLTRRWGTFLSFDDFQASIPTVARPAGGSVIVVTHAPGLESIEEGHPYQEFVAWQVTRDTATPIDLAIEPGYYGLDQLLGHWPLEKLRHKRVLVVGVGSIGGVIATSGVSPK